VWAVLWGLALAGLVRGVGSIPLVDPDEGRNAEVAREMAASGDYAVPHLDALPYLDKPVLFFATAALAIRVLGATETAARLPGIGFTLCAIALVVAFGWHLFGRRAGAVGGLALASAPLVIGNAKLASFDAPLMFWVAASCMAFYLAWEREGRVLWVAGWAAAGLAVLTKGPVGLLLPLLVAVGYGLACGKPLRPLFHPLGLAAFVLLVAPWLAAVAARHPEFLHYAFVRETLERVATGRMRRTGPVWYFVPILALGAAPWAWLVVGGAGPLRRALRERRGAGGAPVFLLLWIALPFAFFTLSQSKRPGYLLPLFPAVALLAAWLFDEAPVARRRVAEAFGLVALVLGVALGLGRGPIAERIHDAPGIQRAVHASLPWLGVALAATGALAAGAAAARRPLGQLAGLVLVPVSVAILGSGVYAAVGEDRSSRSLAEAIREGAPAGIRLIGVKHYPHSLAYYLGRRIDVATGDASELRSNYILDYAEALRARPDSPLHPVDWWRAELEHCNPAAVFVVEDKERVSAELAARLPLLGDTGRVAAYGPCRRGGA
jgi:4-amino-4-deoxy-L-arabinose transferase-like glycosyltransferase